MRFEGDAQPERNDGQLITGRYLPKSGPARPIESESAIGRRDVVRGQNLAGKNDWHSVPMQPDQLDQA